MVFVPAGVTLRGNFVVDGEASYTTVFFTPSPLMAEISPMMAIDPMVNFRHRELEQSLANMSRVRITSSTCWPKAGHFRPWRI